MHKILCSTGAMIGRPNGRNIRLLEGCLDKLTESPYFGGLEFMMYSTWYDTIDEVQAYLRGLQADIPVVHCEKGIGERITRSGAELPEAFEHFTKNCALAKEIGANKLVLHLWNGVDSDSHFQRNLEACGKLMEIAQSYGLTLTVENVVCNVADPMTHLWLLHETYPDLHFTFDTKMAAFHGQLEEIYLPENRDIWDKVAHLHINDYRGGVLDWSSLRALHVGEGQIDFDSFFRFVREQGYSGDFTIEATSFDGDGVIHFEKLVRTMEKIGKML